MHGYSHSSQVQKAKRGYLRPHVITVLFWVTISAVLFDLSVKAAVCFIHWCALKTSHLKETNPSSVIHGYQSIAGHNAHTHSHVDSHLESPGSKKGTLEANPSYDVAIKIKWITDHIILTTEGCIPPAADGDTSLLTLNHIVLDMAANKCLILWLWCNILYTRIVEWWRWNFGITIREWAFLQS